jgi:hypothetical protein
MSKDSKKFFEPRPNYTALKELEMQYYHKPTEKEMRDFLNFWQEIYDLWSQKNSAFEFAYLEEKIRVRKELIEKFGFKV